MGLLGEMITLRKRDGRRLDGIKASVRLPDQIVFGETDPILEVGDRLVRQLPDGEHEEYEVLDTGLQARKLGRRFRQGAHYRARVKKAPAKSSP